MQLSNYSTYGGVAPQVIASAKHTFGNELFHVILDSYCEMKVGEWLRSSNVSPIYILSMTESVPTPVH